MSKKIVILNGGPRPNGNTVALIESFSKGAEAAGHKVVRFDIQKMNIGGCLGCCNGGKDINSPCVQKDDMLKIYPDYMDADVVVFASPLYYWQITGQLKIAIDRLFAVSECGQQECIKSKKECVLIMAAGGDGYEETTYWYERLMGHMGWTDKGKILCCGVMNPGDISGNPKLEEAYNLGKSL